MSGGDELRREVERRAVGRCEYCRMHQSLQGATFHVEHVVPQSRGGGLTADNLAWACPGCNLRKSDRVEAVDPVTGKLAPLFNPRSDRWADHFAWNAEHLSALTAVGRATVAVLDLNHPRRVMIRRAEMLFELFPPRE